jgi:hypothetical protein
MAGGLNPPLPPRSVEAHCPPGLALIPLQEQDQFWHTFGYTMRYPRGYSIDSKLFV